MPTITVDMKDLHKLLGQSPDMDKFESLLRLAKAELDAYDSETGEARIELNDTNRPDLWCTEGIARQLRSHLTSKVPDYPFFKKNDTVSNVIEVDPGLKNVRPYVAAFLAKGPAITDEFLIQIIQTQEKLCENYGRKRQNVAIGIYNAEKVQFPVKFVAAKEDEYSFTPLGFEESMNLKRIIDEHPKGKVYGALVSSLEAYPLLVDSNGEVLSFPPIINSRETGEVVVGDSNLFIEATGHDMRQLVLVMNIMAANFADRGWAIEPVKTMLPYDSSMGGEVVVPVDLNLSVQVDLDIFSSTVGDKFNEAEIIDALTSYGVRSVRDKNQVIAYCPAYRDDYLHPMDVVEDFTISRGFDTFEPVMPSAFTVGKLNPITLLTDRVRDLMVGFGFEELISNILTNRTVERENMGIPDEPIITVDNVMTETYSVLRSSVLPSLLRVEAKSSKAAYPHRLFEAGEVCVPDPEANTGSRTEHHLAVLWASAETGFSEIHSVLEMLFFYLVEEYSLQPKEIPFYFEGRSGEIISKGNVIGHIGEVHPEALTRFGITTPCAAFEIGLDPILKD